MKSEINYALFPTLSLPRAGLLATQAIRGRDNRTVLERIKHSGDIFTAWSDHEWVLEGAAVNVAIIGFDGGKESSRTLDGKQASNINADLSTSQDYSAATTLPEMQIVLQSVGTQKTGDFDLDYQAARALLKAPSLAKQPTFRVLRPWLNGLDMSGRPRGKWIIDFGSDMSVDDASKFDAVFDFVLKHVKPQRMSSINAQVKSKWWLHERPRPELRPIIDGCERALITTRHSVHRLFTWIPKNTIPDSALICFGRDDDYFMGVLQSAVHVLWARRMGTQLEDRPRYTPSTCFETFPLPWPPATEDTKHPTYKRIAAAAKELNDLRERWLNPPELLAPLAQILDATDKFLDVPEQARPLIRHSALMAQAAQSPNLKKRTLTNLYNERPTWLKLAHEKLDRAVLAAYAAIDPEGHWSEDWATLYTETGAGGGGTPLPESHPDHAARLATDQIILTNLLRLNHQRSGESK